MRWPFGPPHLTLKPSKKNTKKKKKKNQKSFSVISEIFLLFLVGVQNFPFLTTWPKKRAPKKHYKNRGFSNPFFEKQICVTKRPFLDQKNPKPEIPVIIFFAFFFSFNNKKHKNVLKPYFHSVLANLKKRIFKC